MTTTRGSEKLVFERLGKRALEEKHLREVFEIVGAAGGDIQEWFPRGEPRPDVLQASVRMNAGDVGMLVARLTDPQIGTVPRWFRVFPKGLPAIRDLIVDMELVARPGG